MSSVFGDRENKVRSNEFGVRRQRKEVGSNEFGEIKKSEFGTEEWEMDEQKFDFENLRVYQKALEYVDFVYEITKDFPY